MAMTGRTMWGILVCHAVIACGAMTGGGGRSNESICPSIHHCAPGSFTGTGVKSCCMVLRKNAYNAANMESVGVNTKKMFESVQERLSEDLRSLIEMLLCVDETCIESEFKAKKVEIGGSYSNRSLLKHVSKGLYRCAVEPGVLDGVGCIDDDGDAVCSVKINDTVRLSRNVRAARDASTVEGCVDAPISAKSVVLTGYLDKNGGLSGEGVKSVVLGKIPDADSHKMDFLFYELGPYIGQLSKLLEKKGRAVQLLVEKKMARHEDAEGSDEGCQYYIITLVEYFKDRPGDIQSMTVHWTPCSNHAAFPSDVLGDIKKFGETLLERARSK
jgi:hypothetical protein